MNQVSKAQGSILQLVLIIFLVLVLNIGVFFTNIIENSKAIDRVKSLMKNAWLSLVY